MKNAHYKEDYNRFLKRFKFSNEEEFWKNFEVSRQSLSNYMRSLPFEEKWEIQQKIKEFLTELKKSK